MSQPGSPLSVAFVTAERHSLTHIADGMASTRRIKAMLPRFQDVTKLQFSTLIVLYVSIVSLHADRRRHAPMTL